MNYSDQCAAGRRQAAQMLRECRETGNVPMMVQALREAVADQTGYGVGFLSQVGQEALQ